MEPIDVRRTLGLSTLFARRRYGFLFQLTVSELNSNFMDYVFAANCTRTISVASASSIDFIEVSLTSFSP